MQGKAWAGANTGTCHHKDCIKAPEMFTEWLNVAGRRKTFCWKENLDVRKWELLKKLRECSQPRQRKENPWISPNPDHSLRVEIAYAAMDRMSVRLKTHMENPSAQGDGIRKWTGTSALMKATSQSSVAPSATWGQAKGTSYEPGWGSSPDPTSAGAMILALQPVEHEK